MKAVLFVAAAAIIGNMLAEKFVLKATEDDPTGFVLVQEGIGIDDAARGVTIGLVYLGLKKFLPGA